MSLSLIGCDSDDDTPQKNYLRVGDVEYTLSFGRIDAYGQSTSSEYEGYKLDLTLLSEPIVTSDSNGNSKVIGVEILFETFCSEANKLDCCDYYLSPSEPHAIGTYDYAEFAIYNSENEEDPYSYTEITTGKLNINRNGGEYVITIDCMCENGDQITGFFRGALLYVD